VEPTDELVRVWLAGTLIAETRHAVRVLETSHAPAYYLPRADVRTDLLQPNSRTTWCEFKGRAAYFDVTVGSETATAACWGYPDPTPGFEMLADMVSFYPQRMQRCEVDGEAVLPLPSRFYGDWPTSRVQGPFKGESGTAGW
jgi:uncharacterized protein (DUF427 family)